MNLEENFNYQYHFYRSLLTVFHIIENGHGSSFEARTIYNLSNAALVMQHISCGYNLLIKR